MKEILYVEKFDSEIFKFNTARLKLLRPLNELEINNNQINKYLINNQIKFLIASTIVDPNNLNFLEKHNFNFISIKSLYELCEFKDYKNNASPKFEIKTDKEINFDLNKIEWQELIDTLSFSSHYYKSLKLQKIFTKKIYEKWFENSFNGYADKIFTINFNNEIAGIITLKIKDKEIFIDLLGIRPKFNNLGLGSIILSHAISFAKNLNKKIFVYTQGENIPANRCYQKNGFRIKNIELIYHKFI